MSDSWLRTSENIDGAELMHRVDGSVSAEMGYLAREAQEIAAEIRHALIAPSSELNSSMNPLLLTDADCDIVPRDYVIEWQHPLLGPINAQVRKAINAEIRRYLAASLERQSTINRQLLAAVEQLRAENAELRRKLDG